MEDDNEKYFVNEVDGLPNAHPALPESDVDTENVDNDSDTLDDLPTSLIVTNIHSDVFNSFELKSEIESVFREFSSGEQVTFQWLKSFKRLRVNYDSALSAGTFFIYVYVKN